MVVMISPQQLMPQPVQNIQLLLNIVIIVVIIKKMVNLVGFVKLFLILLLMIKINMNILIIPYIKLIAVMPER